MIHEPLEVSMERNYDGAWYCSAIVDNCRVHGLYYGYTKREARKLFVQDHCTSNHQQGGR